MTVTLVDPTFSPAGADRRRAHRLPTLDGAVLGLVNNGKTHGSRDPSARRATARGHVRDERPDPGDQTRLQLSCGPRGHRDAGPRARPRSSPQSAIEAVARRAVCSTPCNSRTSACPPPRSSPSPSAPRGWPWQRCTGTPTTRSRLSPIRSRACRSRRCWRWRTRSFPRSSACSSRARTAAPAPTSQGPLSLDEIVESLAVSLRSDGADLTAERSGRRITFRLHIPDQACAECIMPSSILAPMLQNRIDAELGRGWTVEIDDPRDVPAKA